MDTTVVVTGMGIVSPLGNTVESFWQGLCEGRSGIRALDGEEFEKLSSRIAGVAEDVVPEGMPPKERRRYNRYAIFGMEAADQAWHQSGLDLGFEDPYRCGVFVGSGIGGLADINSDSVKMYKGGPRRVSPLMIPRGLVNMGSGAIGIRLGLMGPNRAIVTACASGTQSIGDAADIIRLGKADVMLAGGSEATVIPFAMAGFCAMHALSTRNGEPERASRPFDRDRDGFVMGEGAGVVVLESEEHARARGAEIIGVVAGIGETCDAHHITTPRPDGSGAAAAMLAGLDQAKINPEEVGYFNAHGTSTKLNDAGEALALKTVFGEHQPFVSSTKSMTGHLLGAAGAVEAVACMLAIRDSVIPPNTNYDTPDPDCEVNLVANEAREAKVDIAMSNSLGFGGHNGSIIFRRHG